MHLGWSMASFCAYVPAPSLLQQKCHIHTYPQIHVEPSRAVHRLLNSVLTDAEPGGLARSVNHSTSVATIVLVYTLVFSTPVPLERHEGTIGFCARRLKTVIGTHARCRGRRLTSLTAVTGQTFLEVTSAAKGASGKKKKKKANDLPVAFLIWQTCICYQSGGPN